MANRAGTAAIPRRAVRLYAALLSFGLKAAPSSVGCDARLRGLEAKSRAVGSGWARGVLVPPLCSLFVQQRGDDRNRKEAHNDQQRDPRGSLVEACE